MDAHHAVSGLDGPYMEVVDREHAGDGRDGVRHLIRIGAFGRALVEDMDDLFEHSPRTGENDEADENARERVGPGPSGEKHHCTGDNDAHRGKRVAENVEEGRPSVEIIVVMFLEDKGDDEIGREADDGDDQHGTGDDVGGVGESRNGLPENFDGNDEKRRSVGQGGEHLHPPEPEAVPWARRPGREPDSPRAKGEREDVEKNVGRVGKKGEASGEKAADHFRDKGEARDQYGKKKFVSGGTARRRGGRRMPVRMPMRMSDCATHRSHNTEKRFMGSMSAKVLVIYGTLYAIMESQGPD